MHLVEMNCDESLKIQHHDSLVSVSTSISENDKSSTGSPQPVSKSASKIRDLEKLLAKCKESLKTKNAQIQKLRTALLEVEEFRHILDSYKKELEDLRKTHEFWAVSIAENKRATHEELESKNLQIEKMKVEANELRAANNDGAKKILLLKTSIQDLESKLVSTSAAHQRERESLTKELTFAKNNALKQQQEKHQLNLERVKLDLEKSIESLKGEIIAKDEQIIRSVSKQQQLEESNKILTEKLEEGNRHLSEQLKKLENLNTHFDQENFNFLFQELGDEVEILSRKIAEKDHEVVAKDNQFKELNEAIAKLQSELKLTRESKESEIAEWKIAAQNKEKLVSEYLEEIEDNRNLIESYQQKIEDLDAEICGLQSDCKDKDGSIAQMTSELKRLIEDSSPQAQQSTSTNDVPLEKKCTSIATCENEPTDSANIPKQNGSSFEEKEATKNSVSNNSLEPTLISGLATTSSDHTYQIRALQRVLQQYQLENQRLKERSKELMAKAEAIDAIDPASVPDSTQFEYLKNIVYQFMLGKEPLVLARVISAVFKFDEDQIDQICKVQKALQNSVKQAV